MRKADAACVPQGQITRLPGFFDGLMRYPNGNSSKPCVSRVFGRIYESHCVFEILRTFFRTFSAVLINDEKNALCERKTVISQARSETGNRVGQIS